MQPLQYDLRSSAAKDNSITHAAAAPSNLDAAITMRFAASRRKPARIYAHGNTRLQQSCSHSNAICNHRFKKRIELRTQEQLLGWAAWLLSGWAGWWSFISPPTMVTIPPSIVINLPSIWPT